MFSPRFIDKEIRDILWCSFSNNAPQVESMVDVIAMRERCSIPMVITSVRDVAGSTMLHYAAQKEMADRILSHFYFHRPDLVGPFVNTKQRDGELALHWAARGGHRYYCEVLIEAGVAVDTQSNAGKTAVDFAMDSLAKALGNLDKAQKKLEDARNERPRREDWIEASQGEVDRHQDTINRLRRTITYLEPRILAARRAHIS
ncbi:hypothetical protein F4779DRAFT_623706 [Xylariaceae sp. FL0662B]|nr:hypothetical protein F4779DRAFT_623706 [Xylariaceae sp. FL0662B]